MYTAESIMAKEKVVSIGRISYLSASSIQIIPSSDSILKNTILIEFQNISDKYMDDRLRLQLLVMTKVDDDVYNMTYLIPLDALIPLNEGIVIPNEKNWIFDKTPIINNSFGTVYFDKPIDLRTWDIMRVMWGKKITPFLRKEAYHYRIGEGVPKRLFYCDLGSLIYQHLLVNYNEEHDIIKTLTLFEILTAIKHHEEKRDGTKIIVSIKTSSFDIINKEYKL